MIANNKNEYKQKDRKTNRVQKKQMEFGMLNKIKWT